MINSESSRHGLHLCTNTVVRCNAQVILGSLYADIPFPRQFLRSNLWVPVILVNATYPSVLSPSIDVFAIGRCDVNLTNQPFAERSFVECRWYLNQLMLNLSESYLSRDTFFLSDRTNCAPVHFRGEREKNSHFGLFVTQSNWAEIDCLWIPCVSGERNDRQVCCLPVYWDAGMKYTIVPFVLNWSKSSYALMPNSFALKGSSFTKWPYSISWLVFISESASVFTNHSILSPTSRYSLPSSEV